MTPQENTKIVRDAYAAFGRRDVPAMLASMSDDVDWEGVVGAGPNVPTRGVRKGHQQVAKFFEQMAATADFKRFEPRDFLADGDKVVVLGFYESVIKATGRPFASEWVMVFTLRDGKVVRFREFTDTVALSAAS